MTRLRFTRRDQTFRLISDRHIQRGPSFPEPCEVTIDARSQQVSIRATAKEGEEVKTEHVEMPLDLANGLLFNLIKTICKRMLPNSRSLFFPYHSSRGW